MTHTPADIKTDAPKCPGHLFVFEGPDEVGKTSLVTKVACYLKGLGHENTTLSFPGQEKGTIGLHIYKLHHAPEQFGIQALSPLSLQLLHVSAHVDSVENRILPLLRRPSILLLDRYWWSTWAYGRAAGLSLSELRAILAPERLVWNGTRPTTLFLVSRPEARAHPKLLRAYEDLRKKESPKYEIVSVANESPLADVAQMIGDAIIERLALTRRSARQQKPRL